MEFFDVNRYELGYLAWPILIRHARTGRELTYTELAGALGYDTPRVSRAPLWAIQDFCLEKALPPLTCLVVNKRTRLPGCGYRGLTGTLDDARARVFGFDWSTVTRPFKDTAAPPSSRKKQGHSRVISAKVPRSFEVTDQRVRVNGRGPYQAQFKRVMMRAYGGQCALCHTKHPSMLVAAHIVPWAQDSKNRLNPRNGLLLCRTHDAALESGLVVIDPDGRVCVPERSSKKLGTDLKAQLARTRTALRPPAEGMEPDPAFLAWRRSRRSN